MAMRAGAIILLDPRRLLLVKYNSDRCRCLLVMNIEMLEVLGEKKNRVLDRLAIDGKKLREVKRCLMYKCYFSSVEICLSEFRRILQAGNCKILDDISVIIDLINPTIISKNTGACQFS
jgi:hypothetical protein